MADSPALLRAYLRTYLGTKLMLAVAFAISLAWFQAARFAGGDRAWGPALLTSAALGFLVFWARARYDSNRGAVAPGVRSGEFLLPVMPLAALGLLMALAWDDSRSLQQPIAALRADLDAAQVLGPARIHSLLPRGRAVRGRKLRFAWNGPDAATQGRDGFLAIVPIGTKGKFGDRDVAAPDARIYSKPSELPPDQLRIVWNLGWWDENPSATVAVERVPSWPGTPADPVFECDVTVPDDFSPADRGSFAWFFARWGADAKLPDLGVGPRFEFVDVAARPPKGPACIPEIERLILEGRLSESLDLLRELEAGYARTARWKLAASRWLLAVGDDERARNLAETLPR